MDRFRIAVVIPAYNEEKTISEIIKRIGKCARVIVVNDGSTDATAKLARVSGAHVVSHPTNLGYDSALESGFKESMRLGCKHVVTIDADGEHDPALVNEFFRELEIVPLVLGVRPNKQRIAEIIMGWYFKLRYGVDDILCGMKGYDINLYIKNCGFDHVNSIGTELALYALKTKCSFTQLRVLGRDRNDSPRFGGALKGNWRIIKAFHRLLIIDMGRNKLSKVD
jgi:glycosyltransferase involved in cell wall biosynthesis